MLCARWIRVCPDGPARTADVAKWFRSKGSAFSAHASLIEEGLIYPAGNGLVDFRSRAWASSSAVLFRRPSSHMMGGGDVEVALMLGAFRVELDCELQAAGYHVYRKSNLGLCSPYCAL